MTLRIRDIGTQRHRETQKRGQHRVMGTQGSHSDNLLSRDHDGQTDGWWSLGPHPVATAEGLAGASVHGEPGPNAHGHRCVATRQCEALLEKWMPSLGTLGTAIAQRTPRVSGEVGAPGLGVTSHPAGRLQDAAQPSR